MTFRHSLASIVSLVRPRDRLAANAAPEFLALSPDVVRRRLETLSRERRDAERAGLGRLDSYVAELDDEIGETRWLFTKLTVVELAVVRAGEQGRLYG